MGRVKKDLEEVACHKNETSVAVPWGFGPPIDRRSHCTAGSAGWNLADGLEADWKRWVLMTTERGAEFPLGDTVRERDIGWSIGRVCDSVYFLITIIHWGFFPLIILLPVHVVQGITVHLICI